MQETRLQNSWESWVLLIQLSVEILVYKDFTSSPCKYSITRMLSPLACQPFLKTNVAMCQTPMLLSQLPSLETELQLKIAAVSSACAQQHRNTSGWATTEVTSGFRADLAEEATINSSDNQMQKWATCQIPFFMKRDFFLTISSVAKKIQQWFLAGPSVSLSEAMALPREAHTVA